MQPLITVVLAVHNREAYVAETIECVAKQRYDMIELIIVDDGSTDHTADMIYSALNSPGYRGRFVNVVHKHFRRRRGLSKAFHWGLSRAMGDYLTMILAGDLYPCDRLERLCAKVLEAEAEWAFTRVGVIDADGYVDEESPDAARYARIQSRVGTHRSVAFTAMMYHLSVTPGSLFFSRDIYEDAGRLRSLEHAYDWDFFLRACLISEPLYLPELTYYERVRPVEHFRKIDKNELREGPIALRRFFSRVQLDEIESAVIAENPDFVLEFERETMRMGIEDLWLTVGNPRDTFEQVKIWLKDHTP